jgi:hypothetical protein
MPRKTISLEAVATIGIDIGKNTFHLIGLDKMGAIVLRQKLSRNQVDTRLANMPRCLIGMEACAGAHHLSRQLKALDHDARLMPAQYVRPYSKGQKNDFRDAEAIAEAVLRPTMKFVAIKTVEQLDLQGLHRVRERLVCQRTSVINQIRAFLLERGIAVRQGLNPEYDAICAVRAGSVQGFLAGLTTGNGPKFSLPTRKPPLVGSYAFFEDFKRLSRDDMLRMSLHGSHRCNGLSLGSGGGLFGDHACHFGFHPSATGC